MPFVSDCESDGEIGKFLSQNQTDSLAKLVGSDKNQMHHCSCKQGFKNGLNELECYITIGGKGLPGTNGIVYWAHL